MSVDLEQEVKALRDEVKELKHQVMMDFTNHIMVQQKQISSRRGEPGPKGDSVVGPAGRDMVLIVKTDAATNTVRVFDEAGTEKAAIISIPGKDGAPGRDGVSPAPPRDGRDGKDAPSLDEITAKVVKELAARMSRE